MGVTKVSCLLIGCNALQSWLSLNWREAISAGLVLPLEAAAGEYTARMKKGNRRRAEKPQETCGYALVTVLGELYLSLCLSL
jgi:hypothetical protein